MDSTWTIDCLAGLSAPGVGTSVCDGLDKLLMPGVELLVPAAKPTGPDCAVKHLKVIRCTGDGRRMELPLDHSSLPDGLRKEAQKIIDRTAALNSAVVIGATVRRQVSANHYLLGGVLDTGDLSDKATPIKGDKNKWELICPVKTFKYYSCSDYLELETQTNSSDLSLASRWPRGSYYNPIGPKQLAEALKFNAQIMRRVDEDAKVTLRLPSRWCTGWGFFKEENLQPWGGHVMWVAPYREVLWETNGHEPPIPHPFSTSLIRVRTHDSRWHKLSGREGDFTALDFWHYRPGPDDDQLELKLI